MAFARLLSRRQLKQSSPLGPEKNNQLLNGSTTSVVEIKEATTATCLRIFPLLGREPLPPDQVSSRLLARARGIEKKEPDEVIDFGNGNRLRIDGFLPGLIRGLEEYRDNIDGSLLVDSPSFRQDYQNVLDMLLELECVLKALKTNDDSQPNEEADAISALRENPRIKHPLYNPKSMSQDRVYNEIILSVLAGFILIPGIIFLLAGVAVHAHAAAIAFYVLGSALCVISALLIGKIYYDRPSTEERARHGLFHRTGNLLTAIEDDVINRNPKDPERDRIHRANRVPA